jgi:PRC-barrel domain
MLRSTNDLRGYTLRATDGEIGKVDDFLFDDEQWTVRYMVANTGGWLTGRLVLISPIVLGNADWEAKTLAVALTRAQIEQSPDIATDQPVSRQREAELAQYYGYDLYWGGAGLWGAGMAPTPWAVLLCRRSLRARPQPRPSASWPARRQSMAINICAAPTR